LPDRVLYRLTGMPALLLRRGQVGAFAYAVATAHAVGIPRITGLASLLAWLAAVAGNRPTGVAPEPEARGPALAPEGNMGVAGPFCWSRHPLNFAPAPIFWLTPTMTLKRAMFNFVATAYLILGSWHEEVRLREAYGASYGRYQRSGIPFYFPRVARTVP
jgi:methanethiol S-methyltransferase